MSNYEVAMGDQKAAATHELSVEGRLAGYVRAVMTQAEFEELPDGEGIFGRIPGFQGVWANAPTLDGCRLELAEVLVDWVRLRLEWKLAVPVVAGINLNGNAAA